MVTNSNYSDGLAPHDAVRLLGAGRIGLGLAQLLHEAGREVVVASRSPGAARFADVPYAVEPLASVADGGLVVLAVPHDAIAGLLGLLAGLPEGTVVVDVANAVRIGPGGRLRSALDRPHGRWLADLLPGRDVVRAFSHVQDELLVSRAHRQPDQWAVAVAGDADGPVARVAALVSAARYLPVVIGGLDVSAPLDPGGALFPHLFLPGDLCDAVQRDRVATSGAVVGFPG